MKTLNYVSILAMAAALLQACHNPDQKWDSKSSADTLNSMKDSVADSSRTITKDLVMKVSKDDAKFAVEAANGGLAEVELGLLAQQKAADPQVRNFAAMMVKDHSKANDEMKALAKSKGITLPATLSRDEAELKTRLNSKSGKEFDGAYIKAMINDHKEDIKTFQSAIQTLKDSELKAFALKTLPVLKMHLESIQNIHNEK